MLMVQWDNSQLMPLKADRIWLRTQFKAFQAQIDICSFQADIASASADLKVMILFSYISRVDSTIYMIGKRTQYTFMIQQKKEMEDDNMSMKIVLLGDGSVGKTSLLISYTTDIFPQDYVPTIFDNYLATLKYSDYFVKMWLWDTAGQDEYSRLRTLSFPNTDVFLICFSLVDPRSFNHALNKWLPQAEEHCPKAIKIFVGTKSDLFREQQYMINMRNRPIVLPYNVMKSKVEAAGCQLMTCSALCQDGLSQVFNESIRLVMKKKVSSIIKKKEEGSICQLI